MNRRDFLGSIACAFAAAGVAHTIPAFAFDNTRGADLNEDTLLRACVEIQNFKERSGLPVGLRPTKVIFVDRAHIGDGIALRSTAHP